MLASAISTMMDRTECLFFLNTPASLSYDKGNAVVESPWLYYEIGQSQLIRKRVPQRELYESTRLYSESMIIEKSLGFNYNVDLNHLSAINIINLIDWVRRFRLGERIHPLDILYKSVAPGKVSDYFDG